jgi:hypothetical protein
LLILGNTQGSRRAFVLIHSYRERSFFHINLPLRWLYIVPFTFIYKTTLIIKKSRMAVNYKFCQILWMLLTILTFKLDIKMCTSWAHHSYLIKDQRPVRINFLVPHINNIWLH